MADDLVPAPLETANGDTATPFTFVRKKADSVGQPSAPSTPDDSDNVSSNGNHDDQDDRNDTPTNHPPRMHPRFSRAFSVPQLGRLQNPHRTRTVPNGQSDPGTPSSPQFYELSLELADMVQMAIQTLLQISPPQVLDTTREQFSACALSVPTPSMSAMFTAMRNLNYFSASMAAFCAEPPGDTLGPELISHADFDLGELLQSVGDVMSGAAAEAGVDLVLYHGDLSLKYAWVSGSESGLTVALSHVLRQVISVAHPGDSIEVGLFIGFAPAPGQEITDNLVQVDALTESPTAEDGPIHCTIQIAHKFAASSPCEPRPEPHFSSLVLRRLLRQLGGSLASDLPSSTGGRTCELSLTLDRAVSGSAGPAATPSSTGGEPTLEELAAFAETLKGAKVALYASSKGSFAQHVTRYLADWGMDVSHMSGDGDPEHENSPRAPDPLLTIDETPGDTGVVPNVEPKPQRPSFVFIDDDVAVLKERLTALRMEQPYHLMLNPKRPSLQHTRRSTTQVPQLPRVSSPMPTSPVVIVHFTSLGNFKIVKDVLQSILASYLTPNAPALPEVMIVPKPAGPQRVLTQLHMAVTKPTVDPFFSPIATAPSTPGSNSVFSSYTGRSPAASNRPPSARSNSDRSSRSGAKDISERPGLPPPSPLGKINSTEYFSDDGVQLGSTPSSGRLIQSPPGQPSGIFFAPRSKAPKKSAFALTMERDNGQLVLPVSSRRTSISRASSDNPTFSSLHEESSSPRIGGVPVTSESVLPPGSPITVRTEIAETPSQQPKSPVPSPSPTFRRPLRRRTATPDPKVLEKAKATPDIDIVPPISVLIVEDNVVNQMQLAGFMRKKKIKFEKANNGLEAVEKWKTGNFDLILMDIQMPVMDGIEATKEIRRLEKLNAAEGYPPGSPIVPEPNSALSISPYAVSGASPYRSSVIIVAQTASSLQSDRVKALAAGCNDFLTKPVSHHWLNNKVTEWGSIKALQMWADVPPPPDQNGATQQVAEQLHIPESGKRAGKAAAVDRLPSPDKPSPVTPGIPEPNSAAVQNTNYLDSTTPASKELSAGEPSTDVPEDVLPDDTPSLRR